MIAPNINMYASRIYSGPPELRTCIRQIGRKLRAAMHRTMCRSSSSTGHCRGKAPQ